MTKSETWQKHISDWKNSGFTQIEFCKTNNLKVHNFTYWKKQLTLNDDQPKKLIPISITRSANARLLIGSQIASAMLYSIIETAKANGLEPYHYLRTLFTRLPSCERLEDFEKLLPWQVELEELLKV